MSTIYNNARQTAAENNSRPFMVTDAQGCYLMSFGNKEAAQRHQAKAWLLFSVDARGEVKQL